MPARSKSVWMLPGTVPFKLRLPLPFFICHSPDRSTNTASSGSCVLRNKDKASYSLMEKWDKQQRQVKTYPRRQLRKTKDTQEATAPQAAWVASATSTSAKLQAFREALKLCLCHINAICEGAIFVGKEIVSDLPCQRKNPSSQSLGTE